MGFVEFEVDRERRCTGRKYPRSGSLEAEPKAEVLRQGLH